MTFCDPMIMYEGVMLNRIMKAQQLSLSPPSLLISAEVLNDLGKRNSGLSRRTKEMLLYSILIIHCLAH